MLKGEFIIELITIIFPYLVSILVALIAMRSNFRPSKYTQHRDRMFNLYSVMIDSYIKYIPECSNIDAYNNLISNLMKIAYIESDDVKTAAYKVIENITPFEKDFTKWESDFNSLNELLRDKYYYADKPIRQKIRHYSTYKSID